MRKKIGIFLVCMLLLTSFILAVFHLGTVNAADPPFIVKGYVYINDVITEPDEVYLMLEKEMRLATTYSDGLYIIIFSNADPGETGEFFIIQNDVYYTPVIKNFNNRTRNLSL